MADREPVAWITVHGRRVPIFEGESKADAVKKAISGDTKSKTIGSSVHDYQKAIREAKTKEELQEAVRQAGKAGLSKESMDKVMGDAHDKAQELKSQNIDNKERQIAENKQEADKLNSENSTQSVHKRAVQELSDSKYEDGTYDISTRKTVEFNKGYQVTFCQIGDNYSDSEYQQKVNECLKLSSDGKTYAGKFESTPEISFHCNSREQAIAYAKANNQISIWDWENCDQILTGGTGRRK